MSEGKVILLGGSPVIPPCCGSRTASIAALDDDATCGSCGAHFSWSKANELAETVRRPTIVRPAQEQDLAPEQAPTPLFGSRVDDVSVWVDQRRKQGRTAFYIFGIERMKLPPVFDMQSFGDAADLTHIEAAVIFGTIARMFERRYDGSLNVK